jgi:hypothetical protein
MASASRYRVVITMSRETADTLNQNGVRLYGFKAVSGPTSGKPVVWFATGDYGLSTTVEWTESYKAFTSRTTNVGPGTQILVDNDYPVALNDILTVDSPTGTGTVADGGPVDAISVVNATSTPFACGISQQQADGTYAPLAVFPLFGHSEDEMVPVEKVFLMFDSSSANTGTVIERSFSSGIHIDLTGAPQDASGAVTRSVSFDINSSWTANGVAWGTVLPPNTPLVPLLIGRPVRSSM